MRVMLKSKLHRAVVTESNREYQGSITIDSDLMQMVDILPYEQVDIYNLTNGNRFTTYAIKGEAGSGTICINGAAAHLAGVGDCIIICSYSHVSEESARSLKPKIVVLDESNRPRRPVAVETLR